MADASDSKSDAGNSVWVQVPSPALDNRMGSLINQGFPFFVYGFSQLRALKFFVFRKMEMPETQNPPAMRVESICL